MTNRHTYRILLWGILFAGPQHVDAKDTRLSPQERVSLVNHVQELEGRLPELVRRGHLVDAAFVAESIVVLTTVLRSADSDSARLARTRADDCHALLDRSPSDFINSRRNAEQHLRDAVQLFRQGNREFAVPILDGARAIEKQLYGSTSLFYADQEMQRGLVLEYLGNYEYAKTCYNTTIDIRSERLGDGHVLTALAVRQRALCHRQLREYALAINDLKAASQVLEASREDSPSEWMITRKNLGDCYRELGHFAQAVDVFRELLRLAEDNETIPAPVRAEVEISMGVTQQAQGNLLAASSWFEKALNSLEGVPDVSLQEVSILSNSGLNLVAQGQYADAKLKYERALTLAETTFGRKSIVTATILHNDAQLLHQMSATSVGGDFDRLIRAEEQIQEAFHTRRELLTENHPDTAQSLINLGAVQIDLQDAAAASESFRTATRIMQQRLGDEHPDTAICGRWLALAECQQGRFAEAKALLNQALRIRKQKRGFNHPETVETLTDLAWIALYEGDIEKAYEHCAEAAQAFRQSRLRIAAEGLQRAFKSSEQSPLSLLALLELKRERPVQAWEAIEENLAIGLLEDLRSRERGGAEGIPGHRLSDGRISLDRLQAELDGRTALIAWLDVPIGRRGLPEGFAPAHWAIVVTKQGPPLCVNLAPDSAWSDNESLQAEDLATLVVDARTSRSQIIQAADRLRLQRWTPVAAALESTGAPRVNHLIVLPSPGLRGVPIDLLVGPDTAVSYAPNATIWHSLQAQATAQPLASGFLAFGNPSFELPQDFDATTWGEFEPLPGSAVEVAVVSHLFRHKQYEVVSLSGDEADEHRLHQLQAEGRLSAFRCLLFSTHGEPNADRPLLSRLICSRDDLPKLPREQRLDPAHDGMLTAGEVLSQWNLNADLVVLSSCESALGRFAGGEGYVGFSQAFLLAGARSVLVSQWKVNDEATALLMARFYENLLGLRSGHGTSKVGALHEAKLWLRHLSSDERDEMLRQWRAENYILTLEATGVLDQGPFGSPSAWAAFFLVGETGPLVDAEE